MKKNFTFRLPLDEIFDYCVLEYPFAFWQWGYPVASIPGKDASLDELLDHLTDVSSPSYFAIEDMEETKAFFVQAYRQMGYYGYDTEPFEGLLKIRDAKGYLETIFLPEGIEYAYDSVAMLKVQQFLDENDPKMIFIYGEFDPWSATAVDFTDKKNTFKIVSEGGSHATRISTLPEEQRRFVTDKINSWLNE
jgi:hypothetical protein